MASGSGRDSVPAAVRGDRPLSSTNAFAAPGGTDSVAGSPWYFRMPTVFAKSSATSWQRMQDKAFPILGLVLLAISINLANAADPRQPAADGVAGSKAAPSEAQPAAKPAGAAFEPAHRAVSNWRTEARDNLDLPEETKTRLAYGTDWPDVPRCVKLNNYWCIKRARWAGEIAADAESHVAFASAIDGAIAAAMLLRRYYIDYRRHSALAILSRWAPSQCAGSTAAMGGSWTSRAVPAASLARDAPHGIQNTLRARWLATHRQGFPHLDKTRAPRRSAVRSWPLAMMPAPEIAVGMGEPKRPPIPLAKIAALDFTSPVTEPGLGCAGDNTRILNYASRAIEGIVAGANDDLSLFLADGTAGANLPRLLENMAKVEIGPMAARSALIAAAIARLAPRTAGIPSPGDPPRGGAPRPHE